MRKYSWLIMLLSMSAFAQTPMDDFFYSSGKIYVVIGVLVIILLGIAGYLVRLDRKISNIEKERNES